MSEIKLTINGPNEFGVSINGRTKILTDEESLIKEVRECVNNPDDKLKEYRQPIANVVVDRSLPEGVIGVQEAVGRAIKFYNLKHL
jgi:hypothetical protein